MACGGSKGVTARVAVAAALVLMVSATGIAGLPAPHDLRIEHMRSPAIGISESLPRFAWRLPECGRGVRQIAYRIVVSEMDHLGSATVSKWDSGRVNSSDTNGIVYAGDTALEADSIYTWSINWWASTGEMSQTSFGTFEMSPLEDSDWHGAKWIGDEFQRQLQWNFSVPSTTAVVRASLSVDAPGCAVVYVNGNNINGLAGMCQWTEFEKTIIFTTYNVTDHVSAGMNGIGFLLGHITYGAPALRARLLVVLADGTRLNFVSDGTTAPLPPPPPTPPAPPAPPKLCGTATEHEVIELSCPGRGLVSNVSFASFGTPTGSCSGGFTKNPACDYEETMAIVKSACVGKRACVLEPHCSGGMCTLFPNGPLMFEDPCHMVKKNLAVSISCHDGDKVRSAIAGGESSTWLGAHSAIHGDDPWLGTVTDWTTLFGDQKAGWSTASFDPTKSAQTWVGAILAGTNKPPDSAVHLTSPVPPTREVQRLSPIKAAPGPDPGSCILTFAENFVGVVIVKAAAVHVDGSGNITLRHSEVLSNTSNSVDLRWTWNNMDIHLLDAPPTGDLRPSFTWHGFTYVQVEVFGGVSVDCTVDAFEGSKVHATVEKTGNIMFDDSSDGKFLAQLQGLVYRGQLSNVAQGIPTDCPTREKHGWLGDAQTTAEEAMLNFDFEAVYEQYLVTIRDNQSPQGGLPGVVPARHRALDQSYSRPVKRSGATDISWTAAYPLIAGWLVKYYNNIRVAERHWPTLVEYTENLISLASEDTNCPDGLPNFFTWGDWCAVEARKQATPTTGPELAAYNFIAGLDEMASMGKKIGKLSESDRYEALATRFRGALFKTYFNSKNWTFGSDPLVVQSLTAAPLALGGVVPNELEENVVDALVENVKAQDYHQTVGSVGAKVLLQQLAAAGHPDVAMRVATQKTFPSFGYWLSLGATTCWENYSGQPDPSHPPTPTHNHIFLCGGLGEWLYKTVGGISPLVDGYRRARIFPRILAKSGPESTNASVVTPRGTIAVGWQRLAAGAMSIDVSVPAAVESVDVVFLAPGSNGKPSASATLKEGSVTVWTATRGFIRNASKGITGVEWNADNGGSLTAVITQGEYHFAFSP